MGEFCCPIGGSEKDIVTVTLGRSSEIRIRGEVNQYREAGKGSAYLGLVYGDVLPVAPATTVPGRIWSDGDVICLYRVIATDTVCHGQFYRVFPGADIRIRRFLKGTVNRTTTIIIQI